MSPYKYFISGSSGSAPEFISTNATLINMFQSNLDLQFSNATDVFTIQEESAFGNNTMQNVTVRINSSISSMTGKKLGDDFKNILFQDVDHATSLGWKYYFDDNYWIVVNTEILKNLGASCSVRRCNNALRWCDENGVVYTEPCAIEYDITQNRDYTRGVPVTPTGDINIFCQNNTTTGKIKAGQRFLFGNTDNWVAYRLYGDGIRNYINMKTLDNASSHLTQYTMGVNYDNLDTDDLINGVADYYKRTYILNVSPSSLSGNPGDKFELVPVLTLNGLLASKTIEYLTSGSSIATTSSNIVTMNSSGSCNINCYMHENPLVNINVPVIVTSTPTNEYEIRISPNNYSILESDTQVYVVYLYLNGTIQADAFVFSLYDGNVPAENYSFNILGNNSFSITNNHLFVEHPLIINAVSGTNSKQISLMLKGAW
jgi:hypothetical protein